jgi:hypothetical protein
MKRFIRTLKQMDKSRLVLWMNRLAVPLQFLASCGVYFVIEWMSRHSFAEAWTFMTGKPLVFLYNALIIFAFSTIAFLFRRRFAIRVTVYAVWLVFGLVNCIILLNRVTPFTGPDLRLLKDGAKVMGKYISIPVLILIAALILFGIFMLIRLYIVAPKYTGKRNLLLDIAIVGASAAALFGCTQAALSARVISNYFGNIAFAYEDYGFPYCLSVTLLDTGISQPNGYSEKLVSDIVKSEGDEQDTSDGKTNIIFLQLESFMDPEQVEFLNISEDPIPYFRQLMKDYSSGYFRVPVVGAGTANTEFECISGMSLRYFGAGEYPYKTTLKKETCESIPYDLSDLGYKTHAIHDNEASFYSRDTVFPMLGFDTFTSEEYMTKTDDTTETGWMKDSVLTQEIMKTLKSTVEPDYIYTISVQGHGSYPTEPTVENPKFTVTGAEGREQNNNSWEYYCEQINEMDQFIKELTEELSNFDERVVLVMYGDHLPTMGLSTEDLKGRYLFQTQYVIWDNFGLEKKDENIASYQIGAEVLNRIGIHDGTLVRYHQARKNTKNYQSDLEVLQYDMLYGNRYVYGGESPYEKTDMQMGVVPITVESMNQVSGGAYVVTGLNFTDHSVVEVNGEVQDTTFLSPNKLYVTGVEIEPDDTIDVGQQSASSSKKILTRTEEQTAQYYFEQSGDGTAAEDEQAAQQAASASSSQ